jgi:8-oxo-dGTP diphosphatase
MEEGGAVLDQLDYIGCYMMTERLETRWADCFTATISQIGPLTMPEESKGVRLATLEELPALYHVWNPLTQLVFEHSYEVVQRTRNGARRKGAEL